MQRRRLRRLWLRHGTPSEQTTLLTLAVAVGTATGAGVWLFQHGFVLVEAAYRETLLAVLGPALGPWAIVAVLALAGLIVGFLVARLIGAERHHGVAGIMEAVALAGGRLRYGRMPLKAALASFSIGAGASVGPEDPSVQIGANLGSFFGQRLRLSDERVRLLVAAGVASGVAAAFRAPIAGVFFALEVILGDLSTGSFGVVVLAAVIASVVTQVAEPGAYELGIHFYSLGGPAELPLYVLLGLLMAPLSALFIRLLYWQHDLWHALRLARPVKTMLAGAVVGVIAVFAPEVMGTGRETMNQLLNAGGHEWALPALVAMLVGKMVATTVSLGGGFVGGMFAPSLFVGAAFGSLFGHLVGGVFPAAAAANPAAYAMAGMAAAMAGVIRAPMTAILLLFELTGDYHLILPIMLVTTVCLFVVERLAPDGIYHLGLARKGVRLVQGRDIDLMQTIAVRDAFTPAATQTVRADLPAEALDAEFDRTNAHGLLVVDADGLLTGIVSLQDVARARANGGLAGRTVDDICTHDVLTATPDTLVSEALALLGRRDLGRLPVVAAPGSREIVGVLRRRDILRAYDMALERKRDALSRLRNARLALTSDYTVVELLVERGSPADGQLVREVPWPRGAVVASIRRSGGDVIPRGDTRLRAGDRLTVVTDGEHEAALRRLARAAPQQAL